MYYEREDRSVFLVKKDLIKVLLEDYIKKDEKSFFTILNKLFDKEHVKEDYSMYLDTIISILNELGYSFEYRGMEIKVSISKGVKYSVQPSISLAGEGFYRIVNIDEIEKITFFSDTIYNIILHMKEDISILIKLKG